MPKKKSGMELVTFDKMEENELGKGIKGTPFVVLNPIKEGATQGSVRDLGSKEQPEVKVPYDAEVYRYTPQQFMGKDGEPYVKSESDDGKKEPGEDKTAEEKKSKKKTSKKKTAKKTEEKTAPPPAKKETKTEVAIREKDQAEQLVKTLSADKKFVKESEGKKNKILVLKDTIEKSFLTMGIELIEFKEKNRWAALGYISFNAFLADPDINISQSNAYRTMNIVDKFMVKYKLTPKQLLKVGIKKLNMILPIPNNKEEAKEWVNKAGTLSHSDLKKELDEKKRGKAYEIDFSQTGTLSVAENMVYFTDDKSGKREHLRPFIEKYLNDCNVKCTLKVRSK